MNLVHARKAFLQEETDILIKIIYLPGDRYELQTSKRARFFQNLMIVPGPAGHRSNSPFKE